MATDRDRQQLFVLHDLTLAPGTRQVWSVGAVGIALAAPDTKFSRGCHRLVHHRRLPGDRAAVSALL